MLAVPVRSAAPPASASFLALERAAPNRQSMAAGATARQLLEVASQDWAHSWRTVPMGYMQQHQLPDVEATSVEVVPCCRFCEKFVVSDAQLVPLPDYLMGLEGPARQPREKKARAGSEAPGGELLARYPWLARRAATAEGRPREHAEGSQQAEAADLGDEEVDAVFSALEPKRREWQDGRLPPADGFKTTVRGGAWAQQSRGVAFDSIRAEASGASATAWCRAHGLPRSATFTLAKFGERVCSALALAWSARMQYCFDLAQGARPC